MLEKNRWIKRNLDARSIIEETKIDKQIENPTAQDVLEYMLGDQESWAGGEYIVYKYSEIKKRHFIQRFNMIWVYPLFIITIPFQYLLFGELGLNRNSKIGKVVDWLVKFD